MSDLIDYRPMITSRGNYGKGEHFQIWTKVAHMLVWPTCLWITLATSITSGFKDEMRGCKRLTLNQMN